MNWIRKTIFIIGLSFVFLFVFTTNQSRGETLEVEQNKTSFAADNVHTSVFIQPQLASSFLPHYKNPSCSFIKYLISYSSVIPDFKIKTLFIRFDYQDIDRCEKVSLLLFPYHSFW